MIFTEKSDTFVPNFKYPENRTMEPNKNTCIKDLDLYHKLNDTKIEFVVEMKNLHFKNENSKKSKENTNRKNKVERDVKAE